MQVDIGTIDCHPWSNRDNRANPNGKCPIAFNTAFGDRKTRVFLVDLRVENSVKGWSLPLSSSVFDVTETGFNIAIRRIEEEYDGQVLGTWIAIGEPAAIHGLISPKYKVLTVFYAPPGTKDAKSSSSVAYGRGSTLETVTSSSKTFKQNFSVSVDAKVGGVGAGFGLTFGKSVKNSESLEVKKSDATTIEIPGPSVDGIDHNHDEIWLWINPKVDVSLTSSAVTWTLSDAEPAIIQKLFAGQLNGSIPMGPAEKLLEAHGITKADYPDILQYDVLVGSSPEQNPQRFKSLGYSIPYSPPYSKDDSVSTLTKTISYSSTSSFGSEAEQSFAVDATVSLGVKDFMGLAEASMKSTRKWEWTETSSFSRSSGSS